MSMVRGSISWFMPLSLTFSPPQLDPSTVVEQLQKGAQASPILDNQPVSETGEDLARGKPVHQRRTVEGLRLVDDICLNPGEIAVKHGGAFMLERRWAIAGLGPAHCAVRRDTRTLHGGDDLGAVGALRGDAAIGKARAEFVPAIGNEPGGHGVQHHVHPLVMPALVAGAQLIIWPRRTLAASGRPQRLSPRPVRLWSRGPWNTRFAALRRKSARIAAAGSNLEPAPRSQLYRE